MSTPFRRLGRAALVAAIVVTGLTAPLTTGVVAPAAAADLEAFEAGYIMSDAIFYDSTTLDATGVQNFISAQGATCVPTSTTTCLKDFRQDTYTIGADARCTQTYQGAAGETAGQIVAKVAVACGINPQVLVVMLQKEQGLVTAQSGKSATAYKTAMGYGCPDTAPCDASYYGFFNQVYKAAWQMRSYALNPSYFPYRAGLVNQILWSPNTACGSSGVYIQNQATASLYDYTPYQPNAAALAAGYGLGDSCSSYGNRNFWNYFTDWFGSTTQRNPIGSLDVVGTGLGTVTVAGWALDPDTTSPIAVHVYIDGALVRGVTADGDRPDVDAMFHKGALHGFGTTVGTGGGTHDVCVYAIDSNGGSNPLLGCRTVSVVNHPPIGSLDAAVSAVGRITVGGWALDPDTTSSIQVHVYVDGKFALATAATGDRPDVDAAYHLGTAHGFGVTTPALAGGTHNVCVYGIDSSGGPNPLLGCTSVVVTNAPPTGSIDVVRTDMNSLDIAGWALDADTTSPITVHVYVDGTFSTALTASDNRPDVGAAFGLGSAHGFASSITLPLGTHKVCIYGIDTYGGPNPLLGCKSAAVNGYAFGSVDMAAGGAQSITVGGWAIDPNTTDPIAVHVYVDGAFATALTANGNRPDVETAYGMGADHGYGTTVPATTGAHTVCLYAIDSWGGTNPLLRCVGVTAS